MALACKQLDHFSWNCRIANQLNCMTSNSKKSLIVNDCITTIESQVYTIRWCLQRASTWLHFVLEIKQSQSLNHLNTADEAWYSQNAYLHHCLFVCLGSMTGHASLLWFLNHNLRQMLCSPAEFFPKWNDRNEVWYQIWNQFIYKWAHWTVSNQLTQPRDNWTQTSKLL